MEYNLSDELNLTLPETKTVTPKRRGPGILLAGILLVGVLNLVLLLTREAPSALAPLHHGQLPASALRDLALKLEKQGLAGQAVQTWKEYLAAGNLTNEQRAKIWYRVAKILQEQNQPEQALSAYYRSEKTCRLDELESEINTRVQDCLEAAGRFAALRYELSDRVGMDKKDGADEVMAQIGTHKITREELDRKIETRIRRQLDSMAAFLTKEQRRKQQEEMLKKLSTREARQALLRQMIFEEMLYRKAREERLDRKPAIRGLLRDSERSLLANQVLQHELEGKVNITPGDIQTYYEAHKRDFMDNKAKPPRQKPLAEVQAQIYQTLHTRKMSEIRNQLFAELRDKYDVVIHMPLVSGPEQTAPEQRSRQDKGKKRKVEGKRQKTENKKQK